MLFQSWGTPTLTARLTHMLHTRPAPQIPNGSGLL